jgi:hypothetical protein
VGRDRTGRYAASVRAPSAAAGAGALAEVQQEELWGVREIAVEGTESGRLDGYLYGAGQDQGGELYVLTSHNAVPFGDSGAVHKIVPTGGSGSDGT